MTALDYAPGSMSTGWHPSAGPAHQRSPGRPLRLLAAVLAMAPPTLAALAVAPTASAAASTPAPSATAPFVLPRATSTIGGERLSRLGPQVDLPPGTAGPPAVNATAWLVADLTTGDVLASSNAHVPLAPASTLKILTAITLAPRLDPKAVYTAVDADAAIDGTKVGLVPRSRYTVDDLLHGLMMGSGNDTANALASLSGGMPAATAAMAERADRLQACDTVPVNDSGLDAPGQVSSPYDLALFGRAALADRQVAALLRTTAYSFPAGGGSFDTTRKRYQIQNHNRLLRNYDGATGVKNGFTDLARGSFVGSATRGGRSYIVTLMRTEGRNWHDAAALLDWAFAAGSGLRPVGRLADPLPPEAPSNCPVGGGAEPSTPVSGVPATDLGTAPAAAPPPSARVAGSNRTTARPDPTGPGPVAIGLVGGGLAGGGRGGAGGLTRARAIRGLVRRRS